MFFLDEKMTIFKNGQFLDQVQLIILTFKMNHFDFQKNVSPVSFQKFLILKKFYTTRSLIYQSSR